MHHPGFHPPGDIRWMIGMVIAQFVLLVVVWAVYFWAKKAGEPA